MPANLPRRTPARTHFGETVLDRYRQAHIGQAEDIRDRIKRHWSRTKQFDRLIFGDNGTSVLSIESFRVLDTTRIFAAKITRGLELEGKLVKSLRSRASLPVCPTSKIMQLNQMGWGK
jgi:hypothetical protein